MKLKIKIIISSVLLLLLFNFNYIYCISTLVNYKIYNYESYGSSIVGCSFIIGIIIQDEYRIKSFSRNIVNGAWDVWDEEPELSFYQGDQMAYKVKLKDIQYGNITVFNFNVTNTNNETSTLYIETLKPLECKKLLAPFSELNYLDNVKLDILNQYYSLSVYFSISNNLDISKSFKCSLSFSRDCSITKYPTYYSIAGSILNSTGMVQDKLYITFNDLFGGSKTYTTDNNVFSRSNLPTVLESYKLLPENNSLILNYFGPSERVYFYFTYSQLNSDIVVYSTSDEGASVFKSQLGTLVYGTDSLKTYAFGFVAGPRFNYQEINSNPQLSKSIDIKYTINDIINPSEELSVNTSFSQQEETKIIIFTTSFDIPNIMNEFKVSSVYTTQFQTPNIIKGYPYGYSKTSTELSCKYNSESMLLPSTIYDDTFYYYYYSSTYTFNVKVPTSFPGVITSDSEGPVLHSFNHRYIDNYILITVNITDKGSGVFKIYSNYPSYSYNAKEVLVSGDINNGIYQFLISKDYVSITKYELYAVDCFGNRNLGKGFSPFIYTDLNFNSYSIVETKDLEITDITHFKFSKHQVDTSFGELDLTLTIGYNQSGNTNIQTPKLTILRLDSELVIYSGIYNETFGLFDINFKVNARDSGYLKYIIVLEQSYLVYADLEAIFPDERVLLVTNYVDHFPPTITYLKSITNTNLQVATLGEEIEIGWVIEIYDYPVGLKQGYIEVISSVDHEPWVFTIIPNELVPSSDIKSNYTISFKVSPYINQTFFISLVQLVDKNGYSSQYPPKDTTILNFNSFFDNDFESERNIQVNITSNTQVLDINAPKLLNLEFPTLIDSYSNDRVVVFNFSMIDDISGISAKHNPYIYIQFLYDSYIKIQSNRSRVDNSTGIHYYTASVELEYASLAYGSLVSIHGITDNALNVNSFISSQLKQLGFPSSIINSPSSLYPPSILEYTNVNENGGLLYLYGREFTESPIVYMDKGNGFIQVNSPFKSNLAISVDVPNVNGYSVIKFKVKANGVDSNIISIKPIINQIIVSNCTVLNNCSGNGQCINSQCVCLNGYSGLQCESKTNENNETPGDTPSFNSLGLMIDINQVNEIDINGKIIHSYKLSNWTSSTIKSQYQLDSNAYQYISPLKGISTNITIIVDIFKNSTSINFGSNNIQMDKGTMKYTIIFDSYPFSNRFNTLQLIINTTLSSEQSDCRYTSYSLVKGTNSLEWIKLRANDKSIFGKFIQYAIIDYRSVNINNILLSAPTNENQNAVVAIQIPFYYQQAILDPDLGVLFDSDNLASNKDSSCYISNSNGISKNKIIIITVICGFVGVTIVVAAIILTFKKAKMNSFKNKLKNLNKD